MSVLEPLFTNSPTTTRQVEFAALAISALEVWNSNAQEVLTRPLKAFQSATNVHQASIAITAKAL
jgi:hypothetical protein